MPSETPSETPIKNNNLIRIRQQLRENRIKRENQFNEPIEITISKLNSKRLLPNLNRANFRFTNVSLFSITPIDQAIYTYYLISCFIETSDKVLTEANGCIGGNTWVFATKFKHVNTIELSKLHYEILQHNMKLYGFNNISYLSGNCIDYIFDLHSDVMFFDPPWGGIGYKGKDRRLGYLYRGHFFTIDTIITDKYFSKKCKLLVVKLPLKYNMFYIKKNNKFKYYQVFTIRTKNRPVYKLIFLSNNRPIKEVREKFVSELNYKLIESKIKRFKIN